MNQTIDYSNEDAILGVNVINLGITLLQQIFDSTDKRKPPILNQRIEVSSYIQQN